MFNVTDLRSVYEGVEKSSDKLSTNNFLLKFYKFQNFIKMFNMRNVEIIIACMSKYVQT